MFLRIGKIFGKKLILAQKFISPRKSVVVFYLGNEGTCGRQRALIRVKYSNIEYFFHFFICCAKRLRSGVVGLQSKSAFGLLTRAIACRPVAAKAFFEQKSRQVPRLGITSLIMVSPVRVRPSVATPM